MSDDLRKQLKAPDKIQKTLLKVFESGVLYQKQIALVLLPVAVIALAGVGWKYFSDKKTAARRAAVAEIIAVMDKENEGIDKKREELSKKIAEIRKPADATKPVELSADAKKKIEDYEKEMKALKADHTQSQEKFKVYFEANKDKTEGWLAGMLYCSELLSSKKYTEAKPVLTEIIQRSISSKLYQTQARFMLIGVLEELGDFDGALKEADFLATYVSEDLVPQVLLAKGRIQIFKDTKAEAKITLAQLIEKHASTPEAQKARAYLSLIQ